jgi:hypothetical protein
MCIDAQLLITNCTLFRYSNSTQPLPNIAIALYITIKNHMPVPDENSDTPIKPGLRLRNSSAEFRTRLVNSRNFTQFKHQISCELNILKLSDWSYLRLDLPHQLAIKGRISKNGRDEYQRSLEEGYFRDDLMVSSSLLNTAPILQSDLEKDINSYPYCNEVYDNYKEFLRFQKRYGYKDVLGISLDSKFNSGRVLFSVTSKGIDAQNFRRIVSSKSTHLSSIGETFDTVGTEMYPKYFTGNKKKYDDIVSSTAYKVLVEKVSNDLSTKELADHFNISINAVRENLAIIRKAAGRNSNRATYESLALAGYIE